MIFDSKMVDASTQTAADRILQRVMQLAPTSEDEAKKESETRKVGAAVSLPCPALPCDAVTCRSRSLATRLVLCQELIELRRLKKEIEEHKKHEHDHDHDEEEEEAEAVPDDRDVDPAEDDDAVAPLVPFEKIRALFIAREPRPPVFHEDQARHVQSQYRSFLAYYKDKRSVPPPAPAAGEEGAGDTDYSARAVARRQWEGRWRRGRVLKHYGGPLMKRVPPFVRYIRRHEETLAHRVGQVSTVVWCRVVTGQAWTPWHPHAP
jgi:hypothetical protein